MRKKRIFIGSSSEELELAKAAKTILEFEKDFEVTIWNEDLWEKSREIAQMLHTYVLGDKKSNMTRRNQVNKILETNSRMIFLNELQQIIPQIPDIKFAEDIGKLIHSMPVDNIPYFLTLVRFNYAIVCNQ